LKAVPKKKTSHMKKRTRQMAGKGLKDVTALNKCHSLRDTSQCARPTRRNMGVYIESCTEEEDFAYEEENEADGRKGIEGCDGAE